MCAEPLSRAEQPDEEHLFALIAARARRAGDGQLVIASAIGFGGAVIVGLVRPSWWIAALPLLCIGSFGVWGIADRTVADRAMRGDAHDAHDVRGNAPSDPGGIALNGVRIAAAVVGTAAAAIAVLAIMARVLGTWVS